MNEIISVSITSTTRRRSLKDGSIAAYPQWYCEYKDPITKKRRRRAFNRKKDAEAYRSALLVKVAEGNYVDERTSPTVAQAIDHWLADKDGKVKPSTLKGYKVVANGAIRGPLLIGTRQERADYTESGLAPKGARFIDLLGHIKLTALTTAMIRTWHRTIAEQCGSYTANRAKSHLKSILALAEEDFKVRAPSMPTGLSRARHKPKKAILTSEDIRRLIADAKDDPEHGVYYVFPFLAGTRPSEQLGLLWSEVDFDANVVRIRRIQERDGSLDRDDQDGSRDAGDSDEPDAARDVARVARPLSPQGRRAASRLSRPRQATRMAEAADGRWRCLALSELPQALLGAGLQAPRSALRDTALGATCLHLHSSGGRDRGGARGEARWSCKRRLHSATTRKR